MTVKYLCFKITIDYYQHYQAVNYLVTHSYYHSKTGMQFTNPGDQIWSNLSIKRGDVQTTALLCLEC